MIDLEYLRNISMEGLEKFKFRDFFLDIAFFNNIDAKIKFLKTFIYKLQHKHREISFIIKKTSHRCIKYDFLRSKVFFIKNLIGKKKALLDILMKDFEKFLLSIPNLLHKSVIKGSSILKNLEVRRFSSLHEIKEKILLNDFECNNNYIDFDVSAKISGKGFVVLKQKLAMLHRGLGNYMLDLHIFKHGYKEIYSPLMANKESMFATGHFPKFYDDQFSISNTNLWLIPTSEVILSNLIRDLKINITELPFKFVSKTPCFRKEKYSYGYRVKGLIRQHQFDKVELVYITSPDKSYDALDELVSHAEKVLQNLNLSYRVLSLCGSDTGFSSSKTYDLEVWFPKRKVYIEVSSCSNTESFQSRRMNTKFKGEKIGKLKYPHILNGSGLAVGRVLLAIIENYTDEYGNLNIPDVLVQYMNGEKLIKF